MVLLRRFIGDALRRERRDQERTLREVAGSARVSLGYLSEVERGQKEASSELLAAICGALELPMSRLLHEVSDEFALAELTASTSSAPPPAAPSTQEPSVPAPTGPEVTNSVGAAA